VKPGAFKLWGAAAVRVVMISLCKKGLTGKVPAALGQLAALKYLDLNYNQLTGVNCIQL
jgi:Leucine-rich repeat (LRR) protein